MSESNSTSSEPLDLIRLFDICANVQAYDMHCNMVLSDATETIFYTEQDSPEIKSRTKKSDMVFIRGDSVILVSDAANV
ncbi:hypothetical protein KL930_002472 [Ogataea haglerorum]|uniref:Sm domain-containing protein n=1 Tax=Ogataea haglerorum TaxID=1937702 RepID=A0AAN6I1J7_9ASCO|nr:hypothetical protein KL915_002341 [Ogataea haglerorum]KAG7697234.1 hypothetical protein KL951_002596 [Ogataea haglerorum]KAG7707748.1 hypothetical protein KL914_002569 [Ogataea haglerorum]KAG7709785.1 hypothetical protein KL950_002004 [Ogataea haglerorum]KAG7719864.1 hypothetical protein KL913_001833 [Ogataea haglerorum]